MTVNGGGDPGGPEVRGGIAHVPALDGVRGLAVLAVLVMHAGPRSWLPGGFLGVSLFFTLSGYLIASLVVAEVEGRGGVALSRFWARRVRRLVPALVVTVVGIVALSRWIPLPASTRAELLGGLGYVANWVQIAGGQSYAALFESPSAATHLWSLSIEEQFYVAFPFLAWVAARRSLGGLRASLVVGGTVVVLVGVVVAVIVEDQSFSYYSTVTRVPEIAVGVVMAGLWPMGRAGDFWRVGSSGRGAVVGVDLAGLAALGVLAYLSVTTELTAGWIYGGALVVVALVSLTLVIAAGAPGLVARVVAIAPLRGLGLVSYGLYLYHWPVVVLLSAPRVDLAPVPLFVARVAVALVVTIVSYRFVEQPVRLGRIGAGAAPMKVIAAGLGTLVAAAVLVAVGTEGSDTAARPRPRPAPAVVSPGTSPNRSDGSNPTPDGPPVVVILGDSLPNWLVRDGGWALDPEAVTLVDGTSEGCDGAEGAPEGRAGTGVVVTVPESCTGWRSQYPPVFEGRRVDVALLAVGTGAVLDRRIDGDFSGPCQEPARRWYGDDVKARLDYLSERADRVVLMLPVWGESWSGWVYPEDHLTRMDCVRATLKDAASSVPGVEVVDLADEVCPDGPRRCRPVRSNDGVHVDAESAGEVLSWLVSASVG